MSQIGLSNSFSLPAARRLAVTAVMGAALVAGPMSAARADTATGAPTRLADGSSAVHTASSKSPGAKEATSSKGETVEQRIADLHASLKITPEEDAAWNAVAQSMRENAANMEKLIASKKTQAPQGMTAIDDLKTYAEFAQAHVDGLKNLTASFATLYAAMPDEQKKIADQVFRSHGPTHAATRGHRG